MALADFFSGYWRLLGTLLDWRTKLFDSFCTGFIILPESILISITHFLGGYGTRFNLSEEGGGCIFKGEAIDAF